MHTHPTEPKAIRRLLVANRGEIAIRIMRTAHDMGIETVAVYSSADQDAAHVAYADRAILIGDAASEASYLLNKNILWAAQQTGADAIHPGYGFLSENPGLARACMDTGICFVGPPARVIEEMGAKKVAKTIAQEAGVPVVPGYSGDAQDDARLIQEAKTIGFPLLIKASAGGGGRGMRLVEHEDQLQDALTDARSESQRAFGNDTLLLERYIQRPRHIEIQILGDTHGNVIHLGERECSIQRRYQKILEESPSPAVDAALRERMGADAVALAKKVGYVNAGTVEFILDADGNYYFLEMNTRLQVEHPVTEEVYGVDLVRAQLQVAMGMPLSLEQPYVEPLAFALEARLYAEDPSHDFMPSNGKLWRWKPLQVDGVRIDSGVREGDTVSTYYDPMLAKVIARGPTREETRLRMLRALRGLEIAGVQTNREFLIDILEQPAWNAGDTHTHFINTHFPDGWTPKTDAALVHEAALAAVFYDVNQRLAARAHLPHLVGGFRNNAYAPAQETFSIRDQDISVLYRSRGRHFTLNRLDFDVYTAPDASPAPWKAQIEDAVVRLTSPDGLTRHWSVHVQASPEDAPQEVCVHTQDASYVLTRAPRFALPEEEIEEGSCVSPMSGTVLRQLVQQGDTVTAGQTLLVLEAMKMEHRVTAPTDGTVTTLHVQEGDVVDSGVVLAIVEDTREG